MWRRRGRLQAFVFTALAQEKPLCDRLGGPTAISAVVDSFSGKALKDERINKKFAKSDPNRLVTYLKHFVELGAKCAAAKYEGRTMKATHENMAVTEGEFNALVDDLTKTLDEFKVPAKEKGRVARRSGLLQEGHRRKAWRHDDRDGVAGQLQTGAAAEEVNDPFCRRVGYRLAPAFSAPCLAASLPAVRPPLAPPKLMIL